MTTYDYVDAQRPPEPIPLGEASRDAMGYRVILMRRFGVVAGDDVLDPRVVAEWVRGALGLPLPEALERAGAVRAWIAAPGAPEHGHPLATEARRLRWIKHRLAGAEQLAVAGGQSAIALL
jgi:hypothetical protein